MPLSHAVREKIGRNTSQTFFASVKAARRYFEARVEERDGDREGIVLVRIEERVLIGNGDISQIARMADVEGASEPCLSPSRT
jgi:hypothetical protein